MTLSAQRPELAQQHAAHLARQARLWARPVQKVIAPPKSAIQPSVLAFPRIRGKLIGDDHNAHVVAFYRQRLRDEGMDLSRELIKRREFHHRYELIERRACKLFGFSKEDIRGPRKHNELVFARQFVMYWAKRLTGMSYPVIGRLLGGRDHTTTLWGVRKYPEKRMLMNRYLPPISEA